MEEWRRFLPQHTNLVKVFEQMLYFGALIHEFGVVSPRGRELGLKVGTRDEERMPFSGGAKCEFPISVFGVLSNQVIFLPPSRASRFQFPQVYLRRRRSPCRAPRVCVCVSPGPAQRCSCAGVRACATPALT